MIKQEWGLFNLTKEGKYRSNGKKPPSKQHCLPEGI